MDPVSEDILTFWFGTVDLTVPIERRDVWFKATPEFDRHLVESYTDIHERAACGALDHLMETAEDCVALILALDQFPRNIFRGTPKAFHADARARAVARQALERGHDRVVGPQPCKFVYLPFGHSEDLADQELAVELYSALGDQRTLESVVGHRNAIARFGRFPHRNRVLGRPNTPAEEEYLRDPPTWGMTAAEAVALERRKAAAQGMPQN